MTQAFVYQLTGQAILEAQPDLDSITAPGSNEILVETLVTAISPGTICSYCLLKKINIWNRNRAI